MKGLTLDAGALIGVERGTRAVVARLARASERREPLCVPAAALAQVWRDGSRQVLLVRFLAAQGVETVPLDDRTARAVGQLCGVTGTSDIVDASVILCAKQRDHAVLTSDPDDLRRIDPTIRIIAV